MSWDLFLLTFGAGLVYGAVLATLALYLLVISRRTSEVAAPTAPVAPPIYDLENVTRLPRVDRYS